MPRVSVLIPVHDPGPFLEPALRSVHRQSLRDIEVVCIDDGCTDGSAELLDAWARTDARFSVLRPGRVGLVAAANLARQQARAPYLARFDADDAMHPRRLELQAAFLDLHPDVDAVSCLVRHFPKAAVRAGNRAYEDWLNSLRTPDEIARDIFVELPEDYDFWLRAWEAGVRCAKVERVLHYWREHERRVTRTHPRYSVEAFLRAKVAALLRGPLAGARPFVVWGAGMKGRRLTRLLVRAGRPPLALLDIDPRKIGRTRQGRPILPPEAMRPGSALVLGAVGAPGARALIRERLRAWGLAETRDFWMVA
jgi:glycosyltransferase involved in cell wall biosynthesis